MNTSITKNALYGLLCTAAATQAANAATCDYVVSNEWRSGFTASVQIANDGSSTIDDWQVSWEYGDGSTVTNSWNANVSGSDPYTATPLSWNGTIQPGQSVEFGVQGNKGQPGNAAPVPAINGDLCDGNGSSSASSSSAVSSSSESSVSSSASSAAELPSVTLERIFPNLTLEQPTTMVQSPDGERWYILEKRGVVSWVDASNNGASSVNPYIDLSDIVNDSLEGGMLDLAFHPDYPENNSIFLSYTENAPAGSDAALVSVIARYAESEDGMTLVEGSREDILTLEQPFNNHNGGQIRFGPDGYLYIAFGDGGSANDPFNNAQNPDNWYGALLRIDVDSESPYGIPVDNPFAAGGGAPEIYAYGLRNPWRFSFDPQTNRLWAADVGQASFEEVNLIENGGNYGWRCREGFEATDNECTTTGPYIDPVIAYSRDEGQSVTGGFVYRGLTMPELTGAYVFGDYGSGTVWAVTEPMPGEYSRTVLTETDLLISSFARDVNGELYAVDISGGALYQLVEDDASSSRSSSRSSVSSSSSVASSLSSSGAHSSSSVPASVVECAVTPVGIWGGSYQLNVGVSNTGTQALSSWTLEMAFDAPPEVIASWNVELQASGNTLIATDAGWNGELQPGESTSFGFQGSHSGDFVVPDCVGLNLP